MIDNYIDESTLTHLSKKGNQVKVILYTKLIHRQLTLDINKANEQYGGFEVHAFTKSHDRFLIINGETVYHIGASLKDLGKRCLPAVGRVCFHENGKTSVENILSAIFFM